SGGDLDEGKRRYIIRTIGEFRTLEAIRNAIISETAGHPVYVKDVASVTLAHDELRSYVRHNGYPGIAVTARRELGSNIIKVMADLQKVVADLNENLLNPLGLELVQTADKTEYIIRAIEMVQFNILVGGSFAIIILLVFLRSIYSTLVIALAIPISVVGSFLVVTLMGRTINVIMLAGMAFAVGMVVDASIIVLENIHRHRQMGKSAAQAALDGTSEVWGAILASTLTTLAVFVPILFIEEDVGQLFRDIAVAISAAVTLSLIVSILVIPVISKKLLRYEAAHSEAKASLVRRVFRNLFGLVPLAVKFNRAIVFILRKLFQSRLAQGAVILALTIAPVAAAWQMLPKTEYLPEGDQNVIIGMMIPPQGYNIEEAHRIGKEMEDRYRIYWEAEPGSEEAAKLKGPAVRNFLFIGAGGSLFTIVKAKDPNRAKELIPILRNELMKVPGMIAVTRQLSLFSSAFRGSRGIEINIMGPDLVKLTSMAKRSFFKLKKIMPKAQVRPIPGMDLGQPQLQILPRWEEVADMEVDVFKLGYSVSALVDGVFADEVYLDPDRLDAAYVPRDGIDLILKSREQDIKRTQDLNRAMIHTPMGRVVPMSSVASIEETVSSERIQHLERERSITLEVLPPPEMPLEIAIERVRNEIVQPLKEEGALTGGYSIRMTGNADKLERTREALSGNFVLAIFITYLLLAVLFQHWGYPLIVMLSVPMAAVGGVFGLWFMNRFVLQPLDVLTMLGFIILIGVVVNNAILIIYQSLNNAQNGGLAPRDAILESVRTRIRPIFMSAFTSIFGLMPLVVIPGAGSEIYRGIGVVILSGLFFSALFTLFLIPCLLNLGMSGKAASQPPEETAEEVVNSPPFGEN
ncbi:MAG: efflux RND transporter permease subunit, partial [Nitrospinales bacterium]